MRLFRWLLVPIVCVLAVAAFPAFFLRPVAYALIETGDLQKCDCMFVLAGDYYGLRVLKAGELYRQGLARKVFVSGQPHVYDHAEDELAIEFARNRGMTDVPFESMRNEGVSTETEAAQVFDRLQAAGCHTVLVPTSDFHTRRAARILRRVWPGLEVHMAASKTFDFDPETWWTSRQAQKVVFMEWSKTVTSWFGV